MPVGHHRPPDTASGIRCRGHKQHAAPRSGPASRSSGCQVRKAPTNASKKTSSAFLATCTVDRMGTGPAVMTLKTMRTWLCFLLSGALPFCLHMLRADRRPTALPDAPPSGHARCDRESGHVSGCTFLPAAGSCSDDKEASNVFQTEFSSLKDHILVLVCCRLALTTIIFTSLRGPLENIDQASEHAGKSIQHTHVNAHETQMCSPIQAWPLADYVAICKGADETEPTSSDIGQLRDHTDCRFGSHERRRRSGSKGALHAANALTCTTEAWTVTACTDQCRMHGDVARMPTVIFRSLLASSKGCLIGMLHRGERLLPCAMPPQVLCNSQCSIFSHVLGSQLLQATSECSEQRWCIT